MGFSQMKMIKTRLRNRLGEQNLAHLMRTARLRNRLGEQNLAYLMRIAIEMPEKIPHDIVESVVDICAGSSTRRVIPRRRPDSTRKI